MVNLAIAVELAELIGAAAKNVHATADSERCVKVAPCRHNALQKCFATRMTRGVNDAIGYPCVQLKPSLVAKVEREGFLRKALELFLEAAKYNHLVVDDTRGVTVARRRQQTARREAMPLKRACRCTDTRITGATCKRASSEMN